MASQPDPIDLLRQQMQLAGFQQNVFDTFEQLVQTSQQYATQLSQQATCIAQLQQQSQVAQVTAAAAQSMLAQAQAASQAPALLQSAKIKVDKPPICEGNPRKFSDWKFQMEQYFVIVGLNSTTEQAKFAVTRLAERVLTWWRQYSSLPDHQLGTITLEDLLEALDLGFQDIDRETKLWSKMQNLRQTESVQRYISALLGIQLELGSHALDDNAALHQFIQGLRQELKAQVLLQRPDNVAQAAQLIERAETALRFAAPFPRYQNRPRDKSYDRRPPPLQLDLNCMDIDNISRKEISCYECGKKRHYVRDCFVRQRKQLQQQGAPPQPPPKPMPPCRINNVIYPPPPDDHQEDIANKANQEQIWSGSPQQNL